MAFPNRSDSGPAAGSQGPDRGLVWFAEHSLRAALRLDELARNAELDGDPDLAAVFRDARAGNLADAERATRMLGSRP